MAIHQQIQTVTITNIIAISITITITTIRHRDPFQHSHGGGQRGLDVPRAHGVHPDPVRSPLARWPRRDVGRVSERSGWLASRCIACGRMLRECPDGGEAEAEEEAEKEGGGGGHEIASVGASPVFFVSWFIAPLLAADPKGGRRGAAAVRTRKGMADEIEEEGSGRGGMSSEGTRTREERSMGGGGSPYTAPVLVVVGPPLTLEMLIMLLLQPVVCSRMMLKKAARLSLAALPWRRTFVHVQTRWRSSSRTARPKR